MKHVELYQPGIKPVPPEVEAQSLNHWTTREVLGAFIMLHFCLHNLGEKNLFQSYTHTAQEEAHVLESRVSSDDILSPALCIQLPLAFACSAAKYCYLRELLCREGRAWPARLADEGAQSLHLPQSRTSV